MTKTVEEFKAEQLQQLKDDLNSVTNNELMAIVNDYIETAFEHGFEMGYERGYSDATFEYEDGQKEPGL